MYFFYMYIQFGNLIAHRPKKKSVYIKSRTFILRSGFDCISGSTVYFNVLLYFFHIEDTHAEV